jgi:uracil-DNA glycosylase
MLPPIPSGWTPQLGAETRKAYYRELERFVDEERARHDVFPEEEETYAALGLTPFERVRVLILGQDPYPTPGAAHGLAFSVRPEVPVPASLRNIFTELHEDTGAPAPEHGSLVAWAERGVLLLNAVLTVRSGEPNSHKGKGWEKLTDTVIHALGERSTPTVFVLWGRFAQKKERLIDTDRHTVLKSAHPSPLSARNGFFGSRPFSKVNAALARSGFAPIDWTIPAA